MIFSTSTMLLLITHNRLNINDNSGKYNDGKWGYSLNITLDLSEILLFLDLIKKEKKNPSLEQLNMMLYFLENYSQIKEFKKKIKELNFKPQIEFITGALIHFIEDYEDCIGIKNTVLQRSKRKNDSIFTQQILLSKSREQAINNMEEASVYGIKLGEPWINRFDSLWIIKSAQKDWRRNIMYLNFIPKIYEEFHEMKSSYFENISLNKLKQILEPQPILNENLKSIQTSSFRRRIYVREFAKKVAKGICQLCDNNAPFLDIQGNPFLEVHHIHYLSKGGSDTIDNVVALCPNCHRKIHQLGLQEDINKIKEKAMTDLSILQL